MGTENTDATEVIKRKSINKSWRIQRVKYNKRELVFADRWMIESEIRHGINYGYGLAQDLFMRPSAFWFHRHDGAVAELTNRERMIAATVIQWLGTNCGWDFLEECLRKCGYKIVKLDRQ